MRHCRSCGAVIDLVTIEVPGNDWGKNVGDEVWVVEQVSAEGTDEVTCPGDSTGQHFPAPRTGLIGSKAGLSAVTSPPSAESLKAVPPPPDYTAKISLVTALSKIMATDPSALGHLTAAEKDVLYTKLTAAHDKIALLLDGGL